MQGNWTPQAVREMVETIGNAIDRVKKGHEPSDTTQVLAQMGDLCCMIELEAKAYAERHPCGCTKGKKPPVERAPEPSAIQRGPAREIFKRPAPKLRASDGRERETPTATRQPGSIEVDDRELVPTARKRPRIEQMDDLEWDAVLLRKPSVSKLI